MIYFSILDHVKDSKCCGLDVELRQRNRKSHFLTLSGYKNAKYFRCSVLHVWPLGDQCPPADVHFGMMPVHFPPSWKHVGERWYTWDSILHTSDHAGMSMVWGRPTGLLKRTFPRKKQPFQTLLHSLVLYMTLPQHIQSLTNRRTCQTPL